MPARTECTVQLLEPLDRLSDQARLGLLGQQVPVRAGLDLVGYARVLDVDHHGKARLEVWVPWSWVPAVPTLLARQT